MATNEDRARTRLNADDDGTGRGAAPDPYTGRDSGPDLEMHADELRPIAEDTHELRQALGAAAHHASNASDSAAGTLELAGLATGAALSRAATRYKEKADELAQDCRDIEEHLGYTVSSQAAVEQDIAAQLRRVGGDLDPYTELFRAVPGGRASGPPPVIPHVTPIAGIDY
ncbi:hypothetical protein ACWGNE_24895 [Streptomyces xiamenensis]